MIVPASHLARELAEDFGVPREKIAVLHNPVDEASLRSKAREPIRFAGEGARFVAVGRLTDQKGFDRLLEMMAATSESAHLTILGDGPSAKSRRKRRSAPSFWRRRDRISSRR